MQRNAIGFGTIGFILFMLSISFAVASLVPCTGDLNLDVETTPKSLNRNILWFHQVGKSFIRLACMLMIVTYNS